MHKSRRNPDEYETEFRLPTVNGEIVWFRNENKVLRIRQERPYLFNISTSTRSRWGNSGEARRAFYTFMETGQIPHDIGSNQ